MHRELSLEPLTQTLRKTIALDYPCGLLTTWNSRLGVGLTDVRVYTHLKCNIPSIIPPQFLSTTQLRPNTAGKLESDFIL